MPLYSKNEFQRSQLRRSVKKTQNMRERERERDREMLAESTYKKLKV